jgi:Mannosyltransferase putative/Glycosyltransferase family 9 (heptosyltransferase)
MTKLIIRSFYSLGDIVLLTAAVRDLHRRFPGVFATDTRTPFPELWENNPYLTRLDEYDPEAKVVECDLPLVNQSNEAACHCLHGFLDFLNRYLGTTMKPTEFRGDIHLSRREQARPSPVRPWAGQAIPYWVLSAGGKYDYTIKWWDARRYQEVVDRFRGRVQFVQVGAGGHYHPKLEGVIDLRGRTSIRDLIRLIHHASGVLCGVTGLMHLAAAVPTRKRHSPARPCVVVAGGRESPPWEAYPAHRFLHTVGTLPCCATGGCWKSRTVALGDGDEKDRPEDLCVAVVNGLPRCMDLISSAEVIRSIETYLEGGACRGLARTEARAASRAVAATSDWTLDAAPLNFYSAPEAAARFIRTIPKYPGGFRGRGIVLCGGGPRLFSNAWVCIRMLRRAGCSLPIELWHLGASELDARMRALVEPWGVACVDALPVRGPEPSPPLHGWGLKAFSVLKSRFEEILLLDADNMPLRNPEFLFRAPGYQRTGAVFWPDHGRLAPERTAWKAFAVPYRDEPEFETGQFLVHKRRCWRPLVLAQWYNEHSDFFYRHVYGDKDTFHMAFRKLEAAYAMPRTALQYLSGGAMCQHDFQGRRLFQHRNGDKWTLFNTNRRIRGFRFERACREYLRELGAVWDGRVDGCELGPAPFPSPGRESILPAREARLAAFITQRAGGQNQNGASPTLANLARTDWGEPLPRVWTDQRRFRSLADRLAHTVWRGLEAGLETDAEYFLWLGDALDFNCHFRANLLAWPPYRERRIVVASLFNPGFRETGWELAGQAARVEPGPNFCSQALLLARSAAEFFLRHWFEAPPEVNVKLGVLASRLNHPILCHCPSLVKTAGRDNAWEGGAYQARDFDARWRAPALVSDGEDGLPDPVTADPGAGLAGEENVK